MKKLITSMVLLLTFGAYSQTVIYSENFDQPSGADSITQAKSQVAALPWNDTSVVNTTPGHSFHAQGNTASTVWFETDLFSTHTSDHLYLYFDQIAEVYSANICQVYISTNNGTTWNLLQNSRYLGNANSYIGYFNENSYSEWSGLTTPTNSLWKKEVFDLDLFRFYSNVKLKFQVTFNSKDFSLTPSQYHHGWFVDNIEVVSSACDLVPPSILISTQNMLMCDSSYPRGAMAYYSNGFSATTVFNVVDNKAVESVKIYETINGVSQPAANLFNTSGSKYMHSFGGYTSTDTVSYYIEAKDTCGNSSFFPDTGSYTFYFVPFAAKCQGGNCGGGHSFVDEFPYVQDFEGAGWMPGFGISGFSVRGSVPSSPWLRFDPPIGNNHGWSVRNSSTPFASTGPDGDHTSGSGNFIYSHWVSKGYSQITSYTPPCIMLDSNNNYSLSFYYHMFGHQIDRMTVEVDFTGGSAPYWHVVKTISGEQQSSANSSWKKTILDLSPYRGKIIKIRFRAFIGAQDVYGHVALDDIEIKASPDNDISTDTILSPNALACTGTSNLPVQVQISSFGINPDSLVSLAYQLDNNPVVNDTFALANNSIGDTSWFTFTQPISYTSAAPHTLKVWSTVAGDTTNQNDTAVFDIAAQNFQTISSFPNLLDFENAPNVSNLNSPYWMLNNGSSNASWKVHNGFFGNDTLTPMNTMGPDHKSLVFRTDSSSISTHAELVSQCIDLSSLSNPVLSFQYFTNNFTNLSVWIREVNSFDWINITPVLNSQSAREFMIGTVIPLSAYSGKYVQLKLRAEANTTPASVIIDNILLREKPSRDFAVRRIGLRQLWADDSIVSVVKVHYSNWNAAGNQSFTKVLKAELTDMCNSGAPRITGSSTPSYTLPSGLLNSDINFVNLKFSSPVPSGRYSAKYWVESTGDVFAPNDTFYTQVECLPTVRAPYVNGFESCFNDAFDYGKMQQWEISTPVKSNFGSAHSGNQCAITNADTNCLAVNLYNTLELPRISGLDSLRGVELRFWQNFDFGNDKANFGVVEIFNGANWVNLTAYNNLSSTNWINLISSVNNNNYQLGFSGSTNGWLQSTFPLDAFTGNGTVQIRFTTTASGVAGWAIDDFEIFVPNQLSASPINLWLNTGLAHQGNNEATVEIKNSGFSKLQSVEVTVENQGNVLLNETVNLSTALNQGESTTVKLNSALTLDTTMNQLLIYTSLPNNNQDENTSDDTLQVSIIVEDTISTLPVCFDFESNPSFTPLSKNSTRADTLWKSGNPAKVVLQNAHSGSTAWYTGSGNYSPWVDGYVYTPEYTLQGNSCYNLSFWHQYETEYSFDGGLVEFTIDSGRTWQTFGQYWSTDSSWYNTPAIQALDGYRAGWSGSSNGWIKAERSFRSFWHTTVRFRFRFASNGSLSNEGWAIDDVCIEPYQGQCEMIGLQEVVNNHKYELYPNPAQSVINIKVPEKGIYKLSLYDAKGTQIGQYERTIDEDELTQISIHHLPEGIYSLHINSSGSHRNITFIKTYR